MDKFSSYGWILALGTSATMFWQQIKELFIRLTSFVFVRVEIEHELSQLFMEYCWTNLKLVPFSSRHYGGSDVFIRPTNQWGFAAFEVCGKRITFLRGIFPIFLSMESSNPQSPQTFNISYLRGTFNIEEVLIKVSEDKKDVRSGETRYRVQKIFGSRLEHKERNFGQNAQPVALEGSRTSEKGKRYLKWNKNDIGAPVNESPFSALAYSDSIENLHSELKRWKDSKGWYRSKFLDWRFGVLLEGLPGTGKTSFIRAIGQEFDFPVFQFDLLSMTNQDLSESWRSCMTQSPCIIVLEDFDRVKFSEELTLDSLLNCISGIEPADGCLLFVTANDTSQLDKALLRPGRLDRRIFFIPLEKKHREKIANRILSDYPELVHDTVNIGQGETGAQFTQRCSSLALERYWKK